MYDYNKYNTAHYERINLSFEKGLKEKIKEKAKQNGESVNGYITRLLKEDINHE